MFTIQLTVRSHMIQALSLLFLSLFAMMAPQSAHAEVSSFCGDCGPKDR